MPHRDPSGYAHVCVCVCVCVLGGVLHATALLLGPLSAPWSPWKPRRATLRFAARLTCWHVVHGSILRRLGRRLLRLLGRRLLRRRGQLGRHLLRRLGRLLRRLGRILRRPGRRSLLRRLGRLCQRTGFGSFAGHRNGRWGIVARGRRLQPAIGPRRLLGDALVGVERGWQIPELRARHPQEPVVLSKGGRRRRRGTLRVLSWRRRRKRGRGRALKRLRQRRLPRRDTRLRRRWPRGLGISNVGFCFGLLASIYHLPALVVMVIALGIRRSCRSCPVWRRRPWRRRRWGVGLAAAASRGSRRPLLSGLLGLLGGGSGAPRARRRRGLVEHGLDAHRTHSGLLQSPLGGHRSPRAGSASLVESRGSRGMWVSGTLPGQ